MHPCCPLQCCQAPIRRSSTAARLPPTCLGATATPPRPLRDKNVNYGEAWSNWRRERRELACARSRDERELSARRSYAPPDDRLRRSVRCGFRSPSSTNDRRAVARRARHDSRVQPRLTVSPHETRVLTASKWGCQNAPARGEFEPPGKHLGRVQIRPAYNCLLFTVQLRDTLAVRPTGDSHAPHFSRLCSWPA